MMTKEQDDKVTELNPCLNELIGNSVVVYNKYDSIYKRIISNITSTINILMSQGLINSKDYNQGL